MRKKMLSLMLAALLFLGTATISIPTYASGTGISTAAATAVKITTQPKSVTVKKGSTVKITFKASGDGLTYQWYYKDATASSYTKTNTFKSNSYSVEMTPARAGRKIYCRVTDKYGNTVKTNTVVLRMEDAVKITSQPESVRVAKGSNAKVSVKAEGQGLTYAWYYKDKGASSFKKTDTFKGTTYNVVMNSKRNDRQIYCVITDKYGCSVKTDTVTISMGNCAKITTQPKSVTVKKGSTVKITFKASGDGLTYQWYYKDATASSYTKTNTFKGNSYSVEMTPARAGRKIYCRVTDKYGNTVKTNTVVLRMEGAVKITSQPESVRVAKGSNAKVSVKAEGQGLTYAWYYKDKGASSFKKTDTFKGTTYNVVMNSKRNDRQIYCVITDKYGCSVKTDTVTISMGNCAKITTQPKSVTVAKNKTAEVTVKASGDGLTYTWYYRNATASSFKKTDTFKGNTYAVQMAGVRSGRQVYCVVKDKYGNKVKTDVVTLSMQGAAKITTQPKDVVAANGKTATVKLAASGKGLTYQWYCKNTGDKTFQKSSVTKSSYSVNMSTARDERQLYCVVTDKNGNSARTDTVTMHIAAIIVTQPKSASAANGKTAKVSVKALGEGLTYQWYCKNAGDKTFQKSSVTKSSYSVNMSTARDKRQLYCVVTDKYGNSATSKTVVLTLTHTYDAGTVTKKATCMQTGTIVYTCKDCGKKRTETLEKADHLLGDWTVYREATAEHEGVERRYCKDCSYYKDRNTSKLKTAYYITVNPGVGDSYKVPVASNGIYTLKDPSREGYTFKGWKTSAGKDFSSSGTISKKVTVNAVWEVKGTSTLAELKTRTDAGASEILITGNITITEPIFISYETKIYSDGDYTLKRDPSYAGDIFVVGQDRNGTPAVQMHRKAILDLGGGKGTLTIDGNRDKLKVTVAGSALYVGDSATLNIYDGVKISNHRKLGNERVLTNTEFVSASTASMAGGAAVLNLNATVNMYGGVMENNAVYTEYTVVTNDDGTQAWLTTNALGGAVYNRGNFNMYGGTITGSEALRGGGIYSDFIAYLHAGTISNNLAHAYGGGLSTSSSMNADIFVGTEGTSSAKMVFSGNRCVGPGGAMYSNTSSPIIVLGNAVFENNTSDSSGGAIYTAGPLTVRGSSFVGNASVGSGGAIYHHYTKAEFERRHLTLENCSFENNRSNLGGAVILSSSGTAAEAGEGTIATITDCSFTGNQAVLKETSTGSGGALYITRNSDATITNCSFTKNASTGNAGAMATQGGTTVTLTNSTFTDNTALQGGALYTSGGKSLKLTDLTFTGNSATVNASGGAGLGGAMFIDQTPVTVKNIDAHNNTAGVHGGAAYVRAVTLNFGSESEFTGNKAAQHGGAFYLVYVTNSDGSKTGAVLNATGVNFSGNSAMAGGAISARTACVVNMDGGKLADNSVIGDDGKADGDGDGGGAIYVGYGTANLTNVTATGNTASDFGGVVDAAGATVTITGGTYTDNKTNSGGVIFGKSSTVSISNATLSNNESVYEQTGSYNSSIGGGAINITSGTLTIENTTLDGNKSGYYGGAVLTNKSTVTIGKNTVVSNSSGATGAALYFKGGSNVTIADTSITGNTSTMNGVVYQNAGTLDMTKVTATGNKASSGGVLYTSGASTQITLTSSTWSGNSASTGGVIFVENATVTVSGSELKDNTAKNGGAVYNKTGTLNTADTLYSGNKATAGSGGAICMAGGNVNVTGESQFVSNSATNHAGGIYASYFTKEDDSKVPAVLTVDGATFQGNSALGGGAVSIRTGCSATLKNTTLTENSVTGDDGKDDGYGEGGGAVYVGYGELTLDKVTATGNTSSTYGGAVQVIESSVTITSGSYTKNVGGTGGAVYVSKASTATIQDVNFTENSATSHGGALYLSDAAVTASNLDFSKNTATSNGGALYLNAIELAVDSEWTFTENAAGGHGGAVYLTYKTNEDKTKTGAVLNATGVTFEGNTALAGGAISARTACAINLDGVTLKDNSVTGFVDTNNGDGEGGGAIYVGYGTANLTNVTATGNTASDFGGVVDAVGATVTITGGAYTGNKTNSGGVIHAMSKSTVTITGATFKENKSLYEHGESLNSSIGGGAVHAVGGTLNISGTTLEGNTSTYYGGAIHTNGTTVTIDGNSVITKSEGATGAACYFANSSNVTMENASVTDNASTGNGVLYIYGTMTLDSVPATGNSAYAGGVLYASGASTKVTLANSIWSGNSATEGGALYLKDGATVDLVNFTMKENTGKYGGAVNVYNGAKLNLNGTTFQDNSATSSGGVIYIKAATVTSTDTENVTNTFTGNTAEDHGGAIYVNYIKGTEGQANTPGILNMTGGLLENNTALAGGAISARTSCQVSLTDTVLKGNTATIASTGSDKAGGGAIYSNDGTLTLSGVTLEGNTSGYYGGAVYSLNTVLTATDNCVVKGNSAITGTALWLTIKADTTATLTDMTLADNLCGKGNSNGTIYATGSGTLNITNLTASGNTSTNGGILFTSGGLTAAIKDSALTGNNASTGGVIAYRGSKTLTVTGTAFSGNTAVNGGTIEASGSGKVIIKSSTLEGNTATKTGGAIYATGSGKVEISDNTSIKSNTATSGGAIFADSGASVTIDGSTLEANTASTGDGGAIVVADTTTTDTSTIGEAATTLTMTNVTLKNNTANLQGGAISTDEKSPNLVINATGCTFDSNTASTKGGGAVEIKNANCTTADDPTAVTLVFKDCTFTGNKSTKSTGGAVEIRTSSCAKFDGIVATGNSAKANGGAIYVTSNYSRLYLTGVVTQSGNTTGEKGPFINLYNNNYSNPPKIYTTHASDAAWVSDVGGNSTSIAFGLETLP